MTLRPDRRSGVTLIEILVVLTITSLLASVLIPAVGRARDTARRTICLTHLKGIVTGIHSYAIDSKGSIPYGPKSPPPSPSNFYPVTGLVTSQLSLTTGETVGLGLMLADHLGKQPKILFCPAADQRVDAEKELAKVGDRQAIGSYYYRHGSNTLFTVRQPLDTWDDRTKLDKLGTNSDGRPITALVVDQNFLTGVPLDAYGIINRTNHKQEWVSAAFKDGHAETRRNILGRYTVDVGSFPYNGPNKILRVFEKFDAQ